MPHERDALGWGPVCGETRHSAIVQSGLPDGGLRRTGRSPGDRDPHGLPPGVWGPYERPAGSGGHGRKRGSRRPRLFLVLVASVAAHLVAVFANSGALVALVTLAGLLLCAVVIRAEG